MFGRSYLQLSREGLNEQKSQLGGIGIPVSRPFNSPYHLYASRVEKVLPEHEANFFEGIDVSLAGIADYVPAAEHKLWHERFAVLSAQVNDAVKAYDATDPRSQRPHWRRDWPRLAN